MSTSTEQLKQQVQAIADEISAGITLTCTNCGNELEWIDDDWNHSCNGEHACDNDSGDAVGYESNWITEFMDEHDELPGAMDYLDQALDYKFLVDGRLNFCSGHIIVCTGGPNIWINTHTGRVEGYWGSNETFANFRDCLGLNDVLCDLYESIR